MTIPSRPAPAPPGPRGLNAAAGANASLERLRQQLQHQQQQQRQHLTAQQHQNGGVQLLTIKLPPPPPNSRSINSGTPPLGSSLLQKNNNNNISNNNNNNINHITNNSNGSSITRKFPQANVRYAPATSWDGSPFESTTQTTVATNAGNSNGNFKKIPPPRPPPPKVLTNRKMNAPAPPQSVNILNNIFTRKKSTKAPSAPSNNKSGRLTPSSTTASSSTASHSTSSSYMTTSTTYGSSNLNNWYSSGAFSTSYSSLTTSTANTNTATSNTASNQQQEPQLISFDSPPSSPTFTQKSNSDCVSVDSFSSDSNFSSPNNGSGSQPESGFEDDFSARSRSATSPLDPWETVDAFSNNSSDVNAYFTSTASTTTIGTAPVRNLNSINTRIQNSSDNPLCNGKSLLPPAPSLAKPTIIKPKISQKPKAPKPPAINNNLFSSNGISVFEADPPSPPMPHCAPPPPPSSAILDAVVDGTATMETGAGGVVSLLDVISGKADALQLAQGVDNDFKVPETPYGIALYNFDGVEDGDLSLRENEKIYLLKQVSEEWFYGRIRSGCEGIFPVNYIDVRVPLRTTSSSAPSEATKMDISSNFTMQATHTTTTTTIQRNNTKNTTISRSEIPKVKCLYNFPAEVEGDLSLREDDLVTILYKINEDWLFGVVDGRQGQFPANFLEYVPANIPML